MEAERQLCYEMVAISRQEMVVTEVISGLLGPAHVLDVRVRET